MEIIRLYVLRALKSQDSDWAQATLTMPWDLVNFMKSQYDSEKSSNNDLGQVITLTGYTQQAQAMTCENYIQQIWPGTGMCVLRTLQDPFGRCETDFSAQGSRLLDGTVILLKFVTYIH